MFKYFFKVFSLFYPKVCAACNGALTDNELCICSNCLISLPKTNFHADPENPVCKTFWGRVPVSMAASYYYFKKDSPVQSLLHSLKYKGQKGVGLTVGRLYGADLKQFSHFNDVSFVLPVPLHPKKQKKRGYNQSEFFAIGLAESLFAKANNTVLVKTTATESQTKKGRMERVKNVQNVFAVTQPELLVNKHVLLVDDVITTGATIEACVTALATIPGIKISVASIAYAQ